MSPPIPKPSDLPLSQDDWDALPRHVQGAFLVYVTTLELRIRKLEEEVRVLRARLDQDSSNSSKPPSSDLAGKKKHPSMRERKLKRHPGAQVGHEGSRRKTIPADKVTRVVEHRPANCGNCGREIPKEQMVECNHRHQVVEIPEIVPDVTEHRVFAGHCQCGCTTLGQLPPEAEYGTGPRLTALAAELSGRYRLSREETADLLGDVLDVPICKGTVQACCERTSDALEVPVEEVEKALPDAPVVHMDETGWKVAGKKAWLWVFASTLTVLFIVHPKRGRAILERVFGKGKPGTVVTDRWCAYTFFDPGRRQLCWSHLLRDLLGILDAKGAGSESAKPMVEAAQQMFSDWHAFRRGEITRAVLGEKVAPFRKTLRAFAEAGAAQKEDKKWRGLGHDMVRYWPAVFRFVDVEGVEPTNNLGERDVRKGVLWRKSSQGTRSEAGSLFVGRILTAAATCRRQGRNLLAFLEAAVLAKMHGRPPPRLLPSST
jgi:transposase